MSTASSEPRWRVLIFPGSTEIALEIREALAWCKEAALFSAAAAVSNHAPFAFGSHAVVPPVSEAGWLEGLRAAIATHRITHVFPAHDDAILALAEYAAKVPARIVSSPVEVCRITRSKSATIRHLAAVVPVPRLFDHPADVREFPVFVKPDRGQGSQGAARANSAEELAALLAADPSRIVLEDLPGEEFTVDCFSDRERGLLHAGGRKRLRVRSGIAMDSVPHNDPAFLDYAQRIDRALRCHGAWFFQVKRDRSGVLKLLEVAPRIAGTSALSRVRGVNLPLLSLYESDRLPCRIAPSTQVVQIDRALRNRYRHELEYRTIYLDFDDTLVVRGRVNHDLVAILYQALGRGTRLVLLTRHGGELEAMLRHYRLAGLFDEVVHLRAGEPKADFVRDRPAVFIDDSFAERTAVHAATGVPVFGPDTVELLRDERI